MRTPGDASALRYWDGAAWTEHRAPKGAPAPRSQIGWFPRLAFLAVLPWLTFELVLLLGPVWAPDAPDVVDRVPHRA